ncbi:MAG: DUF721 domain-containing protein [Acidobacteriota bacterium]|nr:DUF721 domain-containing protein [Acidobacteriota bacterium]
MEPASRLIGKLNGSEPAISFEQIACAAWPRAVGKKIASYTRAAKLVRATLVVEVEDAVWQRHLFGLSGFIMRNLERDIGKGLVSDVEFRVVPKRREPQRAQRSIPVLEDDADRIQDPVLRNIYKAARKRETA